MGKLDDSCRDAVNTVDGAIACGVLDLRTGAVLGFHNGSTYPQALYESVAMKTVEIFRDSGLARLEELVRKHRGVPDDGARDFAEVHIASPHAYHFAKTIANGKAVILLVTKKTTNIGMGWARLKSVLADIEPLAG